MKMNARKERIWAFCLAGVALASSVFVYLSFRDLGFPDGFISERDRAERILSSVFIGVSLPLSVWFGFARGKKLRVTTLLYAIFVMLLMAIDYYVRQQLVSGGGG